MDPTDEVGRALGSLFGPERDGFVRGELGRFRKCAVVVATVSFGAQDSLHQPLNLRPESSSGSGVVCFVAFVDRPTIERYGSATTHRARGGSDCSLDTV